MSTELTSKLSAHHLFSSQFLPHLETRNSPARQPGSQPSQNSAVHQRRCLGWRPYRRSLSRQQLSPVRTATSQARAISCPALPLEWWVLSPPPGCESLMCSGHCLGGDCNIVFRQPALLATSPPSTSAHCHALWMARPVELLSPS